MVRRGERVKLVSLNRVRERREREERDEVKATLVHHARRVPADMDGFGLLMFKHEPGGGFITVTRMFFRDAADGPRLPDLARQEFDRHMQRTPVTLDGDDGA